MIEIAIAAARLNDCKKVSEDRRSVEWTPAHAIKFFTWLFTAEPLSCLWLNGAVGPAQHQTRPQCSDFA
jgi:hypothetical protein